MKTSISSRNLDRLDSSKYSPDGKTDCLDNKIEQLTVSTTKRQSNYPNTFFEYMANLAIWMVYPDETLSK